MKELIKHILTEETNLKTKIHKFIKNLGIRDTMKIFGGNDRFMKKMDINTPMDFLHLFDDLEAAQSEERPNWTLFRYKPKNNLMVYDRNKDNVYINYDEIWSVLYKSFSLTYSEIEELTERWLSEVYNLSGVTIAWNNLNVQFMLSESHNLKRILREEERYDDKVGRIFWFEYHCYESPESCDAEIWYRSHQKVKVIGVSEWSYDDKEWRQEDGNPRVYLVEWSDGYQYDVFEDELMESPDEFHRPDPPKRKIEESLKEETIKEKYKKEYINYHGNIEGFNDNWDNLFNKDFNDGGLMNIPDMNLQENIKRILREESKIPLYIRRRFDCIDSYINRLEQEPGIIPIGRELLSWEHYQIIVTAYIRDNCGDDGYYNENLHNLIMEVFGERLYEWFKKNG